MLIRQGTLARDLHDKVSMFHFQVYSAFYFDTCNTCPLVSMFIAAQSLCSSTRRHPPRLLFPASPILQTGFVPSFQLFHLPFSQVDCFGAFIWQSQCLIRFSAQACKICKTGRSISKHCLVRGILEWKIVYFIFLWMGDFSWQDKDQLLCGWFVKMAFATQVGKVCLTV